MADNAPRMSEAHGHTEPMPHHKVNYFLIFGILVVLTIVTVGVAFINIEQEWIKVVLALTIASIKASFVALFFMHLKFESKLIYFILIVPLILTMILVFALFPDVVLPAWHKMMLGRPY
jgi:cytochrome c oxidase subunit 4